MQGTLFKLTENNDTLTTADISDNGNYINNINPDNHTISKVLNVYNDLGPENLLCKVNCCQQQHSDGIIAELDNNKQTVICSNCIVKYFKLSMSRVKSQNKRLIGLNVKKQQLNTVLQQADELQNKINELKAQEHGANWLYGSLKNFRSHISKEIIENLVHVISEQHAECSTETLEDNSTKEDKIKMFSELKQVTGMEIFINDIRTILIDNLLTPLLSLIKSDKDNVTSNFLNKYLKWSEKIDEQLQLAELTIMQGKEFFRKENLQLLATITKSNAEINKVIEFQNQYKQK